MKKEYGTPIMIKMFFEMEELISTSGIIDQDAGIEDGGDATP